MMFIGHFGVALGAKKLNPNLSLGTLFLATQFLDLLWPVLLIIGIERVHVEPGITVVTPFNFEHYPVSHSLLTAFLWGGVVVATYYVLKKRLIPLLGLVVVSHWVLDWVTHRPDLPLVPGLDLFVGLGLWNSQLGTLIVEGLIFTVGIWFYKFSTTPVDKVGRFGFWGLIIFLVIAYLNNIFGPPPPDDPVIIGSMTLSMWLIVLWAYWVDRHRAIRA